MQSLSHALALAFALALGVGTTACLASSAAATSEGSQPGCNADACDALSKILPGTVNFPNSTEYIKENDFWSNRQADVHPRCFVTPRTASDVSAIIKTLTALKAPFTVKSGGHTAFAGASNIADGVTIDLVLLNEITVASDKSTVSVGPGNRWIDVSRKLDPLGLAVVAGRAADVGVGGFVLGGGISYFSGARGWACDNVRNYEVVTVSGEVVDASPERNPDLYWALRGGGGSSFGIVTRFDLVSFPQGDIWSNMLIFPGAANRTLVPLLTDLAQNGLPKDHDAHTYFINGYVKRLGGFVTVSALFHATPPPKGTVPPVFRPFQAVPGALLNDTQVVNISTQTIALNSDYGSRQTWWDTSVGVSSPELLEDIINLWQAVILEILEAANGTDFLPLLVFQPISQNTIEAMQKNGGNALGLKPRDGPLLVVQLTASWTDKRLDSLIEQSFKQLIDEIEKKATRKGLYRGFEYMNYAGRSQEVLKRYGPESYARLKKTAEKWDPKGILPSLWKGYFQVERHA